MKLSRFCYAVQLLRVVSSADGMHSLSLESPPMDLGMSDPTAWATAMNNLGMAPMGITGDPLLSGRWSSWASPASANMPSLIFLALTCVRDPLLLKHSV